MIQLRDPNVVQTEKMCMEAVRRDGLLLQYVRNQTEAICLEAIKCRGDALKYVNNQTDTICLIALSHWNEINPLIFYATYNTIKYPSPQLINQLLKLYPSRVNIIMAKNEILMENYKTGCSAFVHIMSHTCDLLYRPNNVRVLAYQTKWHKVDSAKTIFLTI